MISRGIMTLVTASLITRLRGLTAHRGCHWRPVPRQQIIEPVALVIVDAVEDVGEIGKRVETVQLGRFNDRHRAREGFRAGICAREEPVFPSDSQFPFILPMSGRFIGFIIDGTPIVARM